MSTVALQKIEAKVSEVIPVSTPGKGFSLYKEYNSGGRIEVMDGEFCEFESYTPPFNGNKILHMLSKGLKQSSRRIINNNKGASDKRIIANIHKRIRDKNFEHNIDEVWVYEKGRVRLLFKKE
jgi:hypothetical protein